MDTVSIKDQVIGGTMVVASMELGDFDRMHMPESVIKSELANQLAKYIIDEKMVEFTRMDRHDSCSTVFRARCYLTPDEQVRFLRKYSV